MSTSNWIRKKPIKRFLILLLTIATLTTVTIAIVIAITNPEITLEEETEYVREYPCGK